MWVLFLITRPQLHPRLSLTAVQSQTAEATGKQQSQANNKCNCCYGTRFKCCKVAEAGSVWFGGADSMNRQREEEEEEERGEDMFS